MIIQVLHEIIVMSTSTVMADGENILSTREPSFSDQDTLSKKSLWNTQGNALASPKMKNGVHRTPKKKSSRGDSGIDVTPEIFVSPSHEPVSDNSNHTWTQYESETRREQFTENSSENTINNDMSNEDSTKSTHPSSIDQTMSLPNTSPSHSEANVSNTPVRTNRTVRQSTSLTSSYTQSVTISTQNDNPIKQSLIDTNSEERPSPTRSPVPGYRWREIPKRLNLRLSPNDLRATRSLTGSPCMSPLRSLQASRSIDEHLNTSGGLLSPALRLSQTSLRGLPATLDQNQYQHCIVCRTCSTQANQIRPPGRHFVLKWKQIISLMLLLSILVGGGGFLFVELEKNEEHERQQTLHLFFTEFKRKYMLIGSFLKNPKHCQTPNPIPQKVQSLNFLSV
ncbi:uncharacterized protein LOC101850073 [Aplysia californica]|uniref:Uncharacterized protein LOC101850073 n=1 Tax=Aplysia californica TaxID=6500 RepID=A0ABM0ZW18_APLCA|nr:uncharacterized protein LOC101850073 [Aplysia californica]